MLTWAPAGASGLHVAAGRVLVVDGDEHVRSHLRDVLRAESYDVVEAPDGPEALALFDQDGADLVLLELSLPGTSGFELCRALRARSDVAIVIVTALRDEVDKVLALEIGVDDYVTKPFLDRELALRAKAVLRRAEHPPTAATMRVMSPLSLQLDPQLQCVTLGDRQIGLSSREFRLLELLVRSGGRLLTRAQIITALWGEGSGADSKTLDAQVRRLRGKIEADPRRPTLLLTVRGRGYRLAI